MNNRSQRTDVYKCDICEEEFESEQELKEHTGDCACSEMGEDNERDEDAINENEPEIPPLTGEEAAEEVDEEDEKKNRMNQQQSSRRQSQDRNQNKMKGKRKK